MTTQQMAGLVLAAACTVLFVYAAAVGAGAAVPPAGGGAARCRPPGRPARRPRPAAGRSGGAVVGAGHAGGAVRGGLRPVSRSSAAAGRAPGAVRRAGRPALSGPGPLGLTAQGEAGFAEQYLMIVFFPAVALAAAPLCAAGDGPVADRHPAGRGADGGGHRAAVPLRLPVVWQRQGGGLCLRGAAAAAGQFLFCAAPDRGAVFLPELCLFGRHAAGQAGAGGAVWAAGVAVPGQRRAAGRLRGPVVDGAAAPGAAVFGPVAAAGGRACGGAGRCIWASTGRCTATLSSLPSTSGNTGITASACSPRRWRS